MARIDNVKATSSPGLNSLLIDLSREAYNKANGDMRIAAQLYFSSLQRLVNKMSYQGAEQQRRESGRKAAEGAAWAKVGAKKAVSDMKTDAMSYDIGLFESTMRLSATLSTLGALVSTGYKAWAANYDPDTDAELTPQDIAAQVAQKGMEAGQSSDLGDTALREAKLTTMGADPSAASALSKREDTTPAKPALSFMEKGKPTIDNTGFPEPRGTATSGSESLGIGGRTGSSPMMGDPIEELPPKNTPSPSLGSEVVPSAKVFEALNRNPDPSLANPSKSALDFGVAKTSPTLEQEKIAKAALEADRIANQNAQSQTLGSLLSNYELNDIFANMFTGNNEFSPDTLAGPGGLGGIT